MAFIEEEDIEETDEDQGILTKQLYLEENSCEENNLSENEDADESATSANLELQPDNFLKLEGARIIDFHYFIAHCLSIMIQIFFYNCGDILGRYFEVEPYQYTPGPVSLRSRSVLPIDISKLWTFITGWPTYYFAHSLSIMIQILYYNYGDILGKYFEIDITQLCG